MRGVRSSVHASASEALRSTKLRHLSPKVYGQTVTYVATTTSKVDASHSDQSMSATTASSTALDANCAPDALVCAVMCVTNAANARRDSDRRRFERE